MGNLQWLLGIGMDRNRKNKTISFSHTVYIQKIIRHFEMEDAKLLSIPINPRHNLTKSQQLASEHNIEEMRHVPYCEVIGSLMYAVVGT